MTLTVAPLNSFCFSKPSLETKTLKPAHHKPLRVLETEARRTAASPVPAPVRARSFCTGRFGHPTWGPQQLKARRGRDGIAFQSVRGRLCVLLEAACVLACGPALSLQGQQPVEPSSPGFLGSLTRSGRRGQRTSLCGPPGRGIRRAVGVLGMGARGACTCQRCVDVYTGC